MRMGDVGVVGSRRDVDSLAYVTASRVISHASKSQYNIFISLARVGISFLYILSGVYSILSIFQSKHLALRVGQGISNLNSARPYMYLTPAVHVVYPIHPQLTRG